MKVCPDLILPVSAMDSRKSSKVWNEIKRVGYRSKIKEDLDQLKKWTNGISRRFS